MPIYNIAISIKKYLLSEFPLKVSKRFKFLPEKEKAFKIFFSNFLCKELHIEKNRGYNAGGCNTNINGKNFENKTNNRKQLLNSGYIDYNYYLEKRFQDKTIIHVLQHDFKKLMKNKFNIKVFRQPDEAYIIEYKTGEKIIKIIEKKVQNVQGSVETKLWAGPALKKEYEIVLENKFKVYYCFCVNDFLQRKIISDNNKYIILNKILYDENINIFFGDDINYINDINTWINS